MDEEIYKQALEITKNEEKVSVAYFQRHLNIGWSVAKSIVNRMVKDQIISAPAKPGAPHKSIIHRGIY